MVKVLEYSKLLVLDSSGKILPSEFRLKNNQISIAFNDQNAIYPIFIDPLLTNPSWTAEGNQAGAHFGCCVDSAGDVNGDGYSDIIIGAYGYDNGETDEGRVYLFLGSVVGLAASAAWSAEGDQVNARFGSTLAHAGDVNGDGYSDVIIGADLYDNSETNEGQVRLYLGSIFGLNSTPSWTAESNQPDANFGRYLSCAGDVNGDGFSDVIIGAPGYDNGELDEGRIFLYLGNVSGLPPSPSWTFESNQASAFCGPVASAGDVNGDGFCDVLTSAFSYSNSEPGEGKCYAFLGSSSGLNTAPIWSFEGNQNYAYLGQSLSSAGDINGDGYADILIGSPSYDNGEMDEGRVYVFHGTATGIAATPASILESNKIAALFGFSISSAGDIDGDGYGDVIIGAKGFTNNESSEGKAFVYKGSSTGLNTTPVWSNEGNQASAFYGHSVASAGDINGDGYSDIIIGAHWFDNDDAEEGQAYVYTGSPHGIYPENNQDYESDQTTSHLGYSLASIGDINSDGFSDISISAPHFDTGLTNVGRVFIFHGKAVGLGDTADQVLDGTADNELFGWSISTAGDVNGDGFGDIVVGAPQYSNGEINEGRIYVFSGNTSGLNASPVLTVESNQAGSQLGFCVAGAGDANGDGYSDILASAPYYNNQGQVSLFTGSAGGANATPQWVLDGTQAEAHFGYSLASAGDVNGDGFSDVIIGAPLYDNGQTDEGRVCLYVGSSAGLNTTPAWIGESDQANARYGHSVSSAGDVNNDGYSDIIIGANLFDGTQSNEGRAYLYHGNPSGLNTNFSWSASSGQNSVQFGCAVATAGDVNNDGFGDVIVGAYQFTNGRTYLYQGGPSGLESIAAWIEESDQSGSQFGYSAASAGDVNGDGFGDIIIGAPLYDDGQADEGKAFLYYGNSGTALNTLPRQMRPGDLSLIGSSGLASNSSDNTDFLVRLVARNSQGRSRVKMQVQVAQVGHPISSGSMYTQPNYLNVGMPGSDLSYTISGLQPRQAYHWRARLLYDPSQSSNGQLHSPWYRMAWGSLNGNADFRTGPVAPATPTPTAIPTVQLPDDFKGQIIDSRHFFVYPNPVRGTNVKFRFFLKQNAQVTIKVFTPQGKFVWETGGNYPVGWSELSWNASGMANGVYFYIGEAKNSIANEKITNKIGLIK